MSRPSPYTTPAHRISSRHSPIFTVKPVTRHETHDIGHEYFKPEHLRSELVGPPTCEIASWWRGKQVWDSAQDGVGDQIHIDYDGEYIRDTAQNTSPNRLQKDRASRIVVLRLPRRAWYLLLAPPLPPPSLWRTPASQLPEVASDWISRIRRGTHTCVPTDRP